MEHLSLLILFLFLLILLLFFLSLVDAAISHLTPVQLKVLAEQERHRQETMLKKLADNPLRVQLHLRIGSQFVIVVIAILTTYYSLQHLQNFALFWSFVTTGLIVFLVRHILPHFLVFRLPEQFLLVLLPILKSFFFLMRPFLWPLLTSWERSSIREKNEERNGEEEAASEEEIQAYLDVGEEQGILEEHDSEMIQSVVEFGNTLVHTVMTPRIEICALPDTSTFGEVRELMLKTKHTRILIYSGQIDNLLGMVNIRQTLAFSEGNGYETPVKDHITPLPFVPETKKVHELLKELQAQKIPMAIVFDEFGGIAGLVTISDLLQEIVGEIRDEDDHSEESIREEGCGIFTVRGDAAPNLLNERLHLDMEVNDFATVSGLMVHQLGHVPKAEEQFPFKNFVVDILESDGRRILKMRFRLEG